MRKWSSVKWSEYRERLANLTWPDKTGLAIILFMALPNRLFVHFRYGIDPSWQFALNTAIGNNREFGTELVWTYGPLGYLSYAMPVHAFVPGILAYKLCLYFGLVCIGTWSYFQSTHWLQKVFVLLVFILAGRLYYFESSLYFLVVFVAALFVLYNRPNFWALSILACFCAINIFIKLNTGFVLVFMLFLYLAFVVIQKKLRLITALVVSIFFLLATIVTAGITHTNLTSYLRHSIEIITYYQDAMVYPVSVHSTGFILAMGVILAFTSIMLHLCWKYKKKFEIYLFLCLIGSTVFISFKQGFVAGANNHQVSFFASVLVLALLLTVVLKNMLPSRVYMVFGYSVLLLVGLAIFNIGVGVYGFANRPFKDLYAKETEPVIPLPPSMLEMIGNSSIDIFPYMGMHAYYNHLHYQPRTVPQGYQAYSSLLDSLNAAYFQSPMAPAYVLLKNGSIFNRPPFTDEFRTKLTIRENYDVVDSCWMADRPGLSKEKNWLLHRKADASTTVRYTAVNSGNFPINDPVDCSNYTSNELVQIQLRYSFWGKLKRFFFQPELLQLHLQYASGEIKTYSAIKPILSAGFYCYSGLVTDKDIENFLYKQPPSEDNRVTSFWFTGNFQFFEPSIIVKKVRVSYTTSHY